MLYVKMCHEANEIQGLWKETPGDFFAFYENGKVKITQVPVQGILKQDNLIGWLPTQEQLQKISIKIPLDNFEFMAFTAPEVEGAEEYRKYGGHQYIEKFTSWSHVWLAFTMYQEFNKIWNGKTWVEAPK